MIFLLKNKPSSFLYLAKWVGLGLVYFLLFFLLSKKVNKGSQGISQTNRTEKVFWTPPVWKVPKGVTQLH